jgi:hypothetical protein
MMDKSGAHSEADVTKELKRQVIRVTDCISQKPKCFVRDILSSSSSWDRRVALLYERLAILAVPRLRLGQHRQTNTVKVKLSTATGHEHGKR